MKDNTLVLLLLAVLLIGATLFVSNFVQLANDMRDLSAPGFNMEKP